MNIAALFFVLLSNATLDILHDEWPVVKCKVNGIDMIALLDTGSPDTYISKTWNKSSSYSKVRIGDIRIGDIEIKKVRGFVISGPSFYGNGVYLRKEHKRRRVDLLIGNDILKNYNLTFDRMRTVTISKEVCESDIVVKMSIESDVPYIKSKINGKTIKIMVDTGADAVYLTKNVSEAFKGLRLNGEHVTCNNSERTKSTILSYLNSFCVKSKCQSGVPVVFPWHVTAFGPQSVFGKERIQVSMRRMELRFCSETEEM